MRSLAVAALAALAVAAVAWAAPLGGVDPRRGGFEVGLGEWSVELEAKAIRPGQVAFVVTNRGRLRHSFRIRSRREDGRGRGGDRWEARTPLLAPGQTYRLTVRLDAGLYEIDCDVEGHDDLGMETVLAVRGDAPLVQPKPAGKGAVQIAGFKFAPATLRVPTGATVRWTNADAAPHTATSATGTFSSPQLRKGQTFARRFPRRGRYAYVCALHPAMRGTVIVGKTG
ncbi:MAG: cupredoxin family copper-binding protein [Actinomycetota bacterium]|nr:cupredoxin family copper-binding protein [Actinomycetota bacterium]